MPTNQPTRSARPVLLPAIVGAAAVMAGLLVLGSDGYTVVRYIVSIFALIVAALAVQHGRWIWALPMAAIAIVWNPVFPLPWEGTLFAALHIIGAATFLAAGLLLRVPDSAQR